MTFTSCPDCRGTRLGPRGSVVEDQGPQHRRRLRDADHRPGRLVRDLDEPVGGSPLLAGLQHLLDSFAEIGLGYLSLDRPWAPCPVARPRTHRDQLSPGLVDLTDVTYVFDEPTIGLHPHDIERMNGLLRQCGTRATPCLRRGTKADDHHRRPRRRPRPRRRLGGRHDLLRRHRGRAARQRHHHRPSSRPTGRRSRNRCAHPPGRWRSGAHRRTTFVTWTWTSPSGSSAWSPVSPAPGKAR